MCLKRLKEIVPQLRAFSACQLSIQFSPNYVEQRMSFSVDVKCEKNDICQWPQI